MSIRILTLVLALAVSGMGCKPRLLHAPPPHIFHKDAPGFTLISGGGVSTGGGMQLRGSFGAMAGSAVPQKGTGITHLPANDGVIHSQ